MKRRFDFLPQAGLKTVSLLGSTTVSLHYKACYTTLLLKLRSTDCRYESQLWQSLGKRPAGNTRARPALSTYTRHCPLTHSTHNLHTTQMNTVRLYCQLGQVLMRADRNSLEATTCKWTSRTFVPGLRAKRHEHAVSLPAKLLPPVLGS